MGRRSYPPEFRRRVLDLIGAGRGVASVAADLGISEQTIYVWRRQKRIDDGIEAGLSSAERTELVAAKPHPRARDRTRRTSASDRTPEGQRGPKSRYAAIQVMAAESHPAKVACRVLGVSESGYYEWRNRPPSPRSLRHARLTELIRRIHADFRGVYGARRVHAELTMGHGRLGGPSSRRDADAARRHPRRIGTPALPSHPEHADCRRSRRPAVSAKRARQALGDGHHGAPNT